MSEKNTYAALRNKMVGEKDRFDRIENALVPGMPDVNYCVNGVEGWIEIKQPSKLPVRDDTAIFGSNHKVSNAQKNWMLRQRRAGGRCWIYVKTNKWQALIDGFYAEEINNWNIKDFKNRSDWFKTSPVRKECWSLLRNKLSIKSKKT